MSRSWDRDMICRTCEKRRDYENNWARGLCPRCYQRHDRAGTLDEIGTPTRSGRPIGYRTLRGDGYAQVMTEHGMEAEHKVVMEQMLGRRMVRGESVHHKNLQRADNQPGNLELWYRQPAGARVSDLIDYVTKYHSRELRRRLYPARQPEHDDQIALPILRVVGND